MKISPFRISSPKARCQRCFIYPSCKPADSEENSGRTDFRKDIWSCFLYIHYFLKSSLNLFIASTVFSLSPNEVSLNQPFPFLPKPSPGNSAWSREPSGWTAIWSFPTRWCWNSMPGWASPWRTAATIMKAHWSTPFTTVKRTVQPTPQPPPGRTAGLTCISCGMRRGQS